MIYTFFYSLNQHVLDRVFSTAIRHKLDLMSLAIKVFIETFSLEPKISMDKETNIAFSNFGNGSRFFIIKENQILSASFPFKMIYENPLKLYIYKEEITIQDLYLTSACIDLVYQEITTGLELISDDIRAIIDSFLIEEMKIEKKYEYKIKSILNHMFFMEDGYLRFDYDPSNQNGHIHPLNHLDVNYSNYSTFKLGLNTQIDFHELANIIRSDTNCFYLKAP
jgi:hypothetical protein